VSGCGEKRYIFIYNFHSAIPAVRIATSVSKHIPVAEWIVLPLGLDRIGSSDQGEFLFEVQLEPVPNLWSANAEFEQNVFCWLVVISTD
jgi:hypothetical protein